MIWALHTLGSSLDLQALAAEAVQRFRVEPDDGDVPGLLIGETGVLLVAYLLGVTDDEARLRAVIRGERAQPDLGAPVGLAGHDPRRPRRGLRRGGERERGGARGGVGPGKRALDADIVGRSQQILGPAHGIAGNVHALRGFLPDDELRARVEPPLRRHVMLDGELANWPPALGDPKIRTQWCHGAPGIVAAIGDLMPRDLLLAGAELTWRTGPLAKGPGLCHGTAGNGYALLKAHAVTGDDVWLERARRFAMHALEQVERGEQGRYTPVHRGCRGGALRPFLPHRRRAISDNGRLVTHEVKLLERGSRPLPRRRDHEGRPVRLLRPRGRRDRAASARPAVHDEALARGAARRCVLPEAGAEGHPVVDRDAASSAPGRAAARASRGSSTSRSSTRARRCSGWCRCTAST